ncbi:hypothetical protein FHT36_004543 [Xanthobacter sp. SG618]|uniref:SGNH/GDSL hydrolase family protein n=1 Tax=Xanthobacter sp. SG618 TaxID=2587121 RepID=UPI00145CD9CB|nr:SGNH/GDSL hydrolase family protein [Xanthobacter sp. SG618]NMN60613.1 hypothetical protein [Xanthobacter sp. SG618]
MSFCPGQQDAGSRPLPARSRFALALAPTLSARQRARLRPWLVALAVAGLAAALVALALHQIPLRARIALEADVRARLSSAPVLAIGDSITYQAAPRSLCGEEVLNAAVPGDKIDDLVSRAGSLESHLQPARVVIAIGANDAVKPKHSIAEWRTLYREIISRFPGSQLVLVEVNPVEHGRSPYADMLDQTYVAQQNAAIRAIGAETGAVVVPAPQSVSTTDGIHPSRAGALLWRARLFSAACR